MKLDIDATATLNALKNIGNNTDFLLSKSLNDVAFNHARADMSDHLRKSLDSNRKYVVGKNAIGVEKSNKKHLDVTVYARQEWMDLHEFRGRDRAENKYNAVPHKKNMGLGSKDKIPMGLRIDTIFKKTRGRKVYKYRGLKPFVLKSGVFIRKGIDIVPIYTFSKVNVYDKKRVSIESVVPKTFTKYFQDALKYNYLKYVKKISK